MKSFNKHIAEENYLQARLRAFDETYGVVDLQSELGNQESAQEGQQEATEHHEELQTQL